MKKILYVFGIVLLAGLQGCIKDAFEEEYGPLASKSCTDGILNQGEYFVDCGGPCEPCGIDTYVSFIVTDKTWLDPDTTAVSVRSNKETFQYFDSTLIGITAEDTLLGITLRMNIDRTWRGVIELDANTISGYFGSPGNVNFESGVVTVTNVDEVNNFISGEFKFNCEPQSSTGVRVSILEGVFKDIPTIEPQ